ncbi:MAG: hypothetical protein E6J81_13815 [Deltaproteobacteria bacterium]|nr:MAG: hypothetical protein E6J81_13815 [Deltaproteobacteria bacterium]TMA70758.1 MAG: hypothetical protein E6J77_26985 [Deltaproteobacteria bacterium]
MKGWRNAVVAVVFVAGFAAARPAQAGYLEDAGWGSLTVLSNVVYMPAKIVYATLGGLTGGLAFALTAGDLQTAETVWVATMAGTYVITPRMLQGEDPIAFAGTPASNTTAEGGTAELNEQSLNGS